MIRQVYVWRRDNGACTDNAGPVLLEWVCYDRIGRRDKTSVKRENEGPAASIYMKTCLSEPKAVGIGW